MVPMHVHRAPAQMQSEPQSDDMRCGALLDVAKSAYPSRFVYSRLHTVAAHCAPGGVRVVSDNGAVV
jgi:hypothetical protein